ncbi:MAG: tetratricopeptide repeat protein [Candidatus Omnitrophica bacterium]|nr:tetratricopeptide repeat protein [Candidatus Omnitrophota bacterium]MDD5737057.1 tetratricopeptide repeat protein [Candidatus Omnitrophota bacterium]
MKRYAIPAALFTILLATFISFYPCLENGFTQWDDNHLVTENRLIRDISPRGIIRIFSTANNSNYNPLTLVSYAVEYRLAGLGDPFVFHATNLGLHLLNSILVFWLIYLISRSAAVSVITALLFGIHPMHVESVAWIAERKDVLYSFFFLSSLVAYLYYTEKSRKKGLYCLSLCLFLLSMLSKSMAVTMPAVLLLVDYLRRRKMDGKALLEKAPFFAIAFIIGAAGYFAQRESGALSQAYFGPAKNAMVAVYGLGFYLKKLFFPTGLSAFYPYPAGAGAAIAGMFFASLPLLFAAAAAVIVSARYTRKAVFGALFFIVVISPVLKFIPLGRAIAADRYVYIAYIGLFYVIAEGLCFFCRRGAAPKFIISAAAAAAICFLSYLTWQRCFAWKDDISLWNDALKLYPSTEAYFGRGVGHANAGRIDDAMRDYNKALEYDPYLSDIYVNRGVLYAAMGQAEKALEDYSTAIVLSPGSYKPYYNRGLIYAAIGDYERSARDFSEAIKLKPDYAEAYSNRGASFGNMGRGKEAIIDFEKALKIDPGCEEALRNRAAYYNSTIDKSGKAP